MAAEWTDKDERQNSHIVEEQKKRGKKTDQAEEVAARTVNKQRCQEGRTPNTITEGTGNPNSPLTSRSKQQLYNRAKQLEIKGRSKMTKSELIEAIRKHG